MGLGKFVDEAVRSQLVHAAALRQAGDLSGAAEAYRGVAHAAAADATSRYFLALIHKIQGELADAERWAREALALAPGNERVGHVLGVSLLAQGRYIEGFPLIGYRPPNAAFKLPEWKGESPAGLRILVMPEQGLGDQIQFMRFIPGLVAAGAQVALMDHAPLRRLYADNLDVPILSTAEQFGAFAPQVWTTSMALGERLSVTLEGLDGAAYLKTPAPRHVGGRIGVVTNGSPIHPNDAQRSLDPASADVLLHLPGAVSLAPEATGAVDLLDTAAIIAGLDLVITVDTSIAHLAGAMGKPVWILLSAYDTDWRWLQDRGDSPWYESAHLFRQSVPGDWSGPLKAVMAALP